MRSKNQCKRYNSEIFYIEAESLLYVIKRRCSSKAYVKCYMNECSGKGVVQNSKLVETKPHDFEKHTIPTESIVNEFKFYNEIREKSANFSKPMKILFDEVYSKYKPLMPGIILTYPQLLPFIKKWRKIKSSLPSSPRSLDDVMHQLDNVALSERFSILNEKFVHLVPSSNESSGTSVACFTNRFLQEFTSLGNLNGYVDATFKFFPDMFQQLLIIHVNVERFAFPVAFIFMSKKTINAYKDVLLFLKHKGINFNEIMTDYESALRKGIKETFIDAKLSGCHFHFGKCLWTNMKAMCQNHDKTLLRKLSTLALLPPSLIIDTFNDIKDEYICEDNKRFFSYFEKFWIKKIKPDGFSVYNSFQRTNNVCESFNSYLKNYEAANINIQNKTNFWKVIEILQEFYKKNCIQYNDYKESAYTARIRRTQESAKKLQKDKNIRSLYRQLDKGLSGYDFVSKFYTNTYEIYLANDSNDDCGLYMSEDDSENEDDNESIMRKCEICLNKRRIVAGYPNCFHIILCMDCGKKVNENRGDCDFVKCVRCRSVSSEVKFAFY